MRKIFITLLILFFAMSTLNATEYLYILDDECINDLYAFAEIHFKDSDITPIKDSRGLILRIHFQDPIYEYQRPNILYYKKIEHFLAKIKNPAIIEVHTNNFPSEKAKNLKKWEISTMIANNIEAFITVPRGTVNQNRINSIGYGEFLPAKNTPNNGGKNLNRIDIMILCNIIGE